MANVLRAVMSFSRPTMAPPTASASVSTDAGATNVSFTRVVELSQEISPDMPLWPGDPEIVFTTVATMEKDGYYLRGFTIGEHSATHMNAPNSFVAGNDEDITSYPAEQRVVPAVVIDATEQCAADADYRLTLQDVEAWEATNGQVPAGAIVLMYTG
jgi:kynurenine formamidase